MLRPPTAWKERLARRNFLLGIQNKSSLLLQIQNCYFVTFYCGRYGVSFALIIIMHSIRIVTFDIDYTLIHDYIAPLR